MTIGTSSSIVTYTGRIIDPINPRIFDVDIEDIAHALSNQCRYTGHTRVFYSVAEHCVRVSQLLEDQGEPAIVQLEGLLHDASEAYLSDLARPIKKGSALGVIYEDIEAGLERVIATKFDLEWPWSLAVKQADNDLLWAEIRDLMPPKMPSGELLDWSTDTCYTRHITPWQPRLAEDNFLYLFDRLRRG